MADFLDAHRRHWEDAEFLFGARRWATADHLYGFAAEGGLKRLMFAFGMRGDSQGDPVDGKDKFHMDGGEGWKRYEAFRSGRPAAANYPLPADDPFVDWYASQRYRHRNRFNSSIVDSHRKGARAIRELIKKADTEGLL